MSNLTYDARNSINNAAAVAVIPAWSRRHRHEWRRVTSHELVYFSMCRLCGMMAEYDYDTDTETHWFPRDRSRQ